MSLKETVPSEKLCSTCDAACCRQNVMMELSSEEVDSLRSAGTGIQLMLYYLIPALESDAKFKDLSYIDKLTFAIGHFAEIQSNSNSSEAEKDEAKQQIMLLHHSNNGNLPYILTTDCGYLDTNTQPPVCSVFSDEERRPEICGKFEEGGFYCRMMRRRGLAEGLSITPKPELDEFAPASI